MPITFTKLTDETLLAMLREGGHRRNKAWEYMYKAWRHAYLAPIRKRGGTDDEGDMALGKIAISFENRILSENHPKVDNIGGYLVQCVLYQWMREKKATAAYVGIEALEQIPDTGLDAGKSLEQHDLSNAVQQLLGHLGQRCRQILQLFAQGFSMIEIAEQLQFKDADKAKKEKYECQTKLKNVLRDNPTLQNTINDLWNE